MTTLLIAAVAIACIIWLGLRECAWERWYALRLEEQRTVDEELTIKNLESSRQRLIKINAIERRLGIGGRNHLALPIEREQTPR